MEFNLSNKVWLKTPNSSMSSRAAELIQWKSPARNGVRQAEGYLGLLWAENQTGTIPQQWKQWLKMTDHFCGSGIFLFNHLL